MSDTFKTIRTFYDCKVGDFAEFFLGYFSTNHVFTNYKAFFFGVLTDFSKPVPVKSLFKIWFWTSSFNFFVGLAFFFKVQNRFKICLYPTFDFMVPLDLFSR